MTLDLSTKVIDVYTGKIHSFDPKVIVPLKERLFQKAIREYGSVVPCGKEHFCILHDKLALWFNTPEHSTKMATIEI